MKCATCHNDCRATRFVTCDGQQSEYTKNMVKPYIPSASQQPITNDYVCLTMKASSGGQDVLELKGCSYSIVNYCMAPNTITNGAVSCAWCSSDGCNNSGTSLSSTKLAILASTLMALAFLIK